MDNRKSSKGYYLGCGFVDIARSSSIYIQKQDTRFFRYGIRKTAPFIGLMADYIVDAVSGFISYFCNATQAHTNVFDDGWIQRNETKASMIFRPVANLFWAQFCVNYVTTDVWRKIMNLKFNDSDSGDGETIPNSVQYYVDWVNEQLPRMHERPKLLAAKACHQLWTVHLPRFKQLNPYWCEQRLNVTHDDFVKHKFKISWEESDIIAEGAGLKCYAPGNTNNYQIVRDLCGFESLSFFFALFDIVFFFALFDIVFFFFCVI